MPLPIGYMSEEASEASNKIYRGARDAHTCKAQRDQTITDVLHNANNVRNQLMKSPSKYFRFWKVETRKNKKKKKGKTKKKKKKKK